MLVFVIDAETNHNLVEEPVLTIVLALRIEVFTGVENKFIRTACETLIFQQWLITTAIRIGNRAGDGSALTAAKKFDTDRGARAAIGDIQYMCR